MKNKRTQGQGSEVRNDGQLVDTVRCQLVHSGWLDRLFIAFVFAAVSFGLLADMSVAQATTDTARENPLSSVPADGQQTVSVALHKSRVIKLKKPVSRVSVANPAIADILVLNARELYVVGKSLGTTNVVIWDKRKRVQRVIGLQVTHDLSSLKEKMHHYLPGEDIRMESAQGSIVLSGEVSSTQKMAAAMDLANTFAAASGENASVLNLMQVGGAQQVLLEVKVAEIARTLVRRMDIDFNLFYNGSSLKFGAVNGGAGLPAVGLPQYPIEGSPFGSNVIAPQAPLAAFGEGEIGNTGAFLSYLGGDTLFQIVVDAARDNGLARILAEPNLTTLSGQEAKFISGGEFPIPVPNEDGITIEFKEYGVGLEFLPLVLDSGLISLQVDVGVSELQAGNSVAIGFTEGTATAGFFVPALTKRAANATVEIPSGQTIAIAGLINENLRESLQNMPGLGDLPVLGNLFRSQEFVKGETELIIFVTPRLARPFDPELIQLPTDAFVEPNEVEFYLLGLLEGRADLGPDKSGAEGRFGHEL